MPKRSNALKRQNNIFPENAFLHYAKGIALGNMGFAKDSERELVTSVKLGSIDDAPAALARVYDQEGRYEEEADVLKSAADRSNRPHWLYLMLGNVELGLGHADLALAAFQKAERESPFHGEAYSLGAEFRSQVAAGKQRAMGSMAVSMCFRQPGNYCGYRRPLGLHRPRQSFPSSSLVVPVPRHFPATFYCSLRLTYCTVKPRSGDRDWVRLRCGHSLNLDGVGYRVCTCARPPSAAGDQREQKDARETSEIQRKRCPLATLRRATRIPANGIKAA